MSQLANRVALVTGAGSGIGAATAGLLAQDGARIAALGRSERPIREIVQQIEAAGGQAIPVVADVGDPAAMEAAIQQIVDRWGRLDIVIANAGSNGVWASLEELAPEEWDATLRNNLTSTFLTVKYAVPHLKLNGGAVVVISSVNGTRNFSNTGATAYSCAKAGQVAFAKMTALELARHRIRVNVVCPGAINSNIHATTEGRDLDRLRFPVSYPEGWHPLRGEYGEAEQVARLIVFLASDAADHITGTEMWIDGGESLLRG